MTFIETDYIVIGGGTAGLVVASRLAEVAGIDIFVLEAGKDRTADPELTVPGFAGKLTGNPEVDWKFETIEQKHAKGRIIDLPRGKAMGGSSSINYMQLGRGHKEEYDAFEILGNAGWNWASFLEAFKKSETHILQPTDKDVFQAVHNPTYDGSKGPIQRTFPKWVPTVTGPFKEGIQSMGVSFNAEAFSGDNGGISAASLAIDYKTAERSSSASAYYEPVKERPNLHVLTEALVTKVSFSGTNSNGLKVASDVRFLRHNEEHVIRAKKEIIICAGAYQSPQILELSGIGDAKLLKSVGIEPIIDLPGVGENLQEHLRCPYMAEMNPKHDTLLALLNPEKAAQEWKIYQETASGMLTSSLGSFFAFLPLSDFVPGKTLINKDTSPFNPTLAIQNKWLQNSTVPHLELAPVPAPIPIPGLQIDPLNKKYFSMLVAHVHPLSRGSVHIKSSDPNEPPSIDLHMLENETDVQLLVEGLKYARKIASTQPMSDEVIEKEILPGPDIQTDEQLAEFVRQTTAVVHHPIGSVSMLPKDAGGVVDSNLLVYGTGNLRVIDASVVPISVSSHTLTTVYAVAEIGAEIIKRTLV